MTQRNPMNQRNQARQNDEFKGKTHKSAARAKPKTAAASSVYVASKSAKDGKKKRGTKAQGTESGELDKQRRRERAMGAQTMKLPEYKHWRRIWWIAIVIGVASVLASWFMSQGQKNDSLPGPLADNATSIGAVLLVIGYAAIIIALWIDLGKIRKLRKKQEAKAASMSKADRRKLDAALDAQEQDAAAKRAAKSAKRPWNRKRGVKGGQEEQAEKESEDVK